MASDHGDVGSEESPTQASGGEAGRLWDPLGAWPAGRRWLWAVLAVLACLLQGPEFIKSIWPDRDKGVDFFQEWASARNLLTGLPIYAEHRAAMERHLARQVDPDAKLSIEVNAHPPTSILLALPLAGLDYPDAVFLWNLGSLAGLAASLWLVGRELGIRFSAWALFPTVTLALLCNPLRQQVNQGQLNLVLLLLVAAAWVAGRSGRDRWAGGLLGLATAIKIFPGFLFLYFALSGRWRAVMAGMLSFAAITLLTVVVLGGETYRDYVLNVVPRLEQFRDEYVNASLAGFWTKLFDPQDVESQATSLGPTATTYVIAWVQPLTRNPALARAGTIISCTVVLAVLACVLRRSRSRPDRGQGFGLALTAMLLVSPITWDHYFLLLLVPLATLWTELPTSNPARLFFLAILFALWINPMLLWDAFIPLHHGDQAGPFRVASPIQTLTVLSFQCYALLGLFANLAVNEWGRARRERVSADQSRNPDQPGS